MAYSKRYPGGFKNLPDTTTPVDAQFLDALETAIEDYESRIGVLETTPGGVVDVTVASISDATTWGKDWLVLADQSAARAALDVPAASAVVNLAGSQTVSGGKTFSTSPIVPAPTAPTHASTKKYVDDAVAPLATAAAVVALTGDQTVAGVKTFSAAPVVPTPSAAGNPTTKSYVDAAVGALPTFGDVPEVASTAIVVEWDTGAATWGTYSTDPARVRQFYSQDDAGATPPTAYNPHDIWYGVEV